MIIAITVLSIILIGVGFIVTENNANQLLTGYNTMPEEERQKFDIKSYITYFRNFHIFLGISLFVIGFLLYYFIDSDWSGIFMGTYPILAYVYFIWKSNKFSKQDDKKQNRKALIAMGIMIVVFTSIVFMFYSSLKDNSIEMNNQMINIQGDFGIDLKTNEVKSVELVNNLPNITSKVNGFALETILKGYFKTDDGEKVKLLINSDKKPVILITTTKDQKIYYQKIGQTLKFIVNYKRLLEIKISANKLKFCFISQENNTTLLPQLPVPARILSCGTRFPGS